MIRYAALVVALTACDAVFGLEHVDTPPAACGPYAEPQPQVFDPALAGVTDFSFGADTTHGSVEATVAGTTRVALANGTWSLDVADAELATLQTTRSTGRVVHDTDIYATTDDAMQLSQYILSPATHTYGAQTPFVDFDPGFNLEIGNEVTTIDPVNGPVFRRAVIVKKPTMDGQKPLLTLFQRQAPFNANTSWIEDRERTAEILGDADLVDLGKAVLTADSQALVYAAKYAGDDTFDLYVSAFDKDLGVFPRGQRIESVSKPDTDETDPSIDPVCGTLSFVRGTEVLIGAM